MEIKIKKNEKKFNEFAVSMKLTEGAILSIKHALEVSPSPVAADVLGFLCRAMTEAGLKP